MYFNSLIDKVNSRYNYL